MHLGKALLSSVVLTATLLVCSPLRAGDNVGSVKKDAAANYISASFAEKSCTACHTKEKYVGLRLGELGWDYVILREKYLRGADIPLSERASLSRHFAQAQPVGTWQTMFEWGLLLFGLASLLSIGAWGFTHLLSSLGNNSRP